MHPPALRQQAREMVAQGFNDCEVARRTGLPRTTVRDMRRAPPRPICPRCWARMKPIACTDADYAELLGLYLGDGHIERAGRTWSLRLTFDTKYPAMNAEIVALMQRCFPANRVDRYENPPSTTIVRVCSSHLPCLFPQHGPGKKHERPISLEPWQRAVISRAPWALLRGLVRSDGCAFVNRFDRYELLSYDFANRSRDILDLFCDTCDAVRVRYRRYETRVRINRRESVALCEREIGLKR